MVGDKSEFTCSQDYLPDKLYSIDQIRAMEKLAIEQCDQTAYQLMQSAGQAVFDLICLKVPNVKKLLVVCGKGNNAGDGYLVASLAQRMGVAVTVVSLFPVDALTGEAKQACLDWQKQQGRTVDASVVFDLDVFAQPYDMIVDAIFGIGLSRPVGAPITDAIQHINRHHAETISIDLPSGICANTGRILGSAVSANYTIALLGLSRGVFTGEAPQYTGQIYFNDLQLGDSIESAIENRGTRIKSSWVNTYLTPRSRIAHKGHFGHVLVVGGNIGMAGAALIAARACLRVGAGLVSLATRAEHAGHLIGFQPEIMCHGVRDEKTIRALCDQASVIVLGPGLGRDRWARMVFKAVLNTRLPLVVDADGLNLLSAEKVCQRDHWVLTPHPGEAVRLLNLKCISAVQSDRFRAAADIAERYTATVVLKGAGSIVMNPDSSYWLCSLGNPGMASGGMGDCLAGVVAGLIAQGIPCAEAAAVGVFLHAKSADYVAKTSGERGMLASDLLLPLQNFVNPDELFT